MAPDFGLPELLVDAWLVVFFVAVFGIAFGVLSFIYGRK